MGRSERDSSIMGRSRRDSSKSFMTRGGGRGTKKDGAATKPSLPSAVFKPPLQKNREEEDEKDEAVARRQLDRRNSDVQVARFRDRR